MCKSVEILNVFNTLTLKQVFRRTKTFFKKIGKSFLNISTKIENGTCPYKTVLPESKVKQIKLGSTKLFTHKERSFPSGYFVSLKILFEFKNLL